VAYKNYKSITMKRYLKKLMTWVKCPLYKIYNPVYIFK